MDAAAGRGDAARRQRAGAFGCGHETPRRQDETDEDAARARRRRADDNIDGERRKDDGVKGDAERDRHGPPAPRRG
jgi:hypothetical protein